MKLLAELNDRDIGTGSVERFDKPYQLRKAVRAVLFNDKKQITFLNVAKRGYHKLPGGGVDAGESLEQALRREVLEEVGYSIGIGQELGVVIEYRNDNDELQISYCYLANVISGDGKTTYEKGEVDDGFEPMWVNIDKAIQLIESDKPEVYNGKFIVVRDLIILKEAKNLLE